MLHELPIAIDVEACFAPKAAAGLPRQTFEAMGEAGSAALTWIRDRRSDGSLPLLALPGRRDDIAAWKTIVDRYRSLYDNVVVLGIGGSSLGGATLCALVDGGGVTGPRVLFLDNIDPIGFDARLARLDLARTGFLAISKSGGTAETLTQLLIVIDRLTERIGIENLGTHITCIAEATENPLRQIASEHGLFCLEHDPNIGGRFSALSVTGLLPAAIAGVDVDAVRRGAAAVLDATLSAEVALDSPVIAGAAINVALARDQGVNQTVLLPYLDRLDRLSFWFRQLWAESLGKDGHGTTPINALGAVDQHSQMQLYLAGPRDKLFTVICSDPRGRGGRVRGEVAGSAAGVLDYLVGRTMGDLMAAEQRATIDTLVRNGCPTRVIRFNTLNEEVMGGLMMQFILETIAAAQMLGIDAFDQPAVEESKVLARQFLREAT
ncbi:MAG: glucose-6-phosphate isomerase [Thalassobaculaceae bacterium]|nr:glucose-6-phosphate isomerase [Thalassobaculaceae bacterium]